MKCKFGDIEVVTKFDPGQTVWRVSNFPDCVGKPNYQAIIESVGEINFHMQLHGVYYTYHFFNLSLHEKNRFEESDLYETKEEACAVAEERQQRWTTMFFKSKT